jgi:hypothetical protein
VRTLFAWEPGDLMVGQRQHACCTGPVSGRRGAVADDVRS